MTLDIPPAPEPLLKENAAQRGQVLPDYILSLTEAGLYAEASQEEDDWQTDEDRAEEVAIVQERMADRIAGDKGILLEHYRAEVLVKREARKHSLTPEARARVTPRPMRSASTASLPTTLMK